MSSVRIKIFYAKGIRVSMKDKTFNQAMKLIWGEPPFCNYDPLKMVFISTGKVLFMDKNAFHAYISGNITQQELIELTECDELYRNTHEVLGLDKGHLWKASQNILTLVSDDDYIETNLNLTLFEVVE
ncbi:MAG: hypothetical protein K2Y30_02070 [Flavobacteriaceae bacterium]|nr:hypothetical protein [Flavobacteriaceae bacterium]